MLVNIHFNINRWIMIENLRRKFNSYNYEIILRRFEEEQIGNSVYTYSETENTSQFDEQCASHYTYPTVLYSVNYIFIVCWWNHQSKSWKLVICLSNVPALIVIMRMFNANNYKIYRYSFTAEELSNCTVVYKQYFSTRALLIYN